MTLKNVDLDLFEPFQDLIEIEILGRAVEVPENNCLLRSLQYVAGDSIAFGRFCWNDECGNCEMSCVSPETGREETIRACQARVYRGMRITAVGDDVILEFESQELER